MSVHWLCPECAPTVREEKTVARLGGGACDGCYRAMYADELRPRETVQILGALARLVASENLAKAVDRKERERSHQDQDGYCSREVCDVCDDMAIKLALYRKVVSK